LGKKRGDMQKMSKSARERAYPFWQMKSPNSLVDITHDQQTWLCAYQKTSGRQGIIRTEVEFTKMSIGILHMNAECFLIKIICSTDVNIITNIINFFRRIA
jgi:hypothetical protein